MAVTLLDTHNGPSSYPIHSSSHGHLRARLLHSSRRTSSRSERHANIRVRRSLRERVVASGSCDLCEDNWLFILNDVVRETNSGNAVVAETFDAVPGIRISSELLGVLSLVATFVQVCHCCWPGREMELPVPFDSSSYLSEST
eukprot:scaffold338641_cov47-Prasinocladus_malaysianus.AAC.1